MKGRANHGKRGRVESVQQLWLIDYKMKSLDLLF